jgi:uncharacterized protein (TIGR03435 family)
MLSKLMLSALLLTSVPVWALPQMPSKASAADAAMTFETATIKPSKSEEGFSIQIQGRRFATTGTTLIDVMKYAYGLHATQIVGVPKSLQSERFDVLADPPTETRPPSDQIKAMVRGLVTKRFGMNSHIEKRELPVYAIVAAKGGPKLSKSILDPDSIPSGIGSPGTGRFRAVNASMQDIAAFLQRYVMDRPVIDETGIAGRFDVNIRWTPDGATAGADDLPGFYTAIQEQLGLQLEAVKAPVDVLVIDHVEQPSAN